MNPELLIEKIGQRIKEIRIKKNLTYTEISDISDIDEANIRRLERGDTNPTLTTLLKISEGLGIKLKDLIDFE
ncbi:MAG: helix-turn-helix transcriptional regulator [Candidatus Shapirobacteria bacterium]|nr:helix-turn-helix transcriptional regulator [Candidatus Shapirobacteria bacterium]